MATPQEHWARMKQGIYELVGKGQPEESAALSTILHELTIIRADLDELKELAAKTPKPKKEV